MKPKVLVYRKLTADVLELVERNTDVIYLPELEKMSPETYYPLLKSVEGMLGSRLKINNQLLDHAPKLRIVCNCSAGYDNFDMSELNKRGIMATNISGCMDLTESAADAIMGLLITAARRLSECERWVKEGMWNEIIPERLYGVEVHHKVLGIIGMGNIGAAIARRAHYGFRMKILYHNRTPNVEIASEVNGTFVQLDELLQQSDFVCLMTPLTSETRYIIDKRQFELMKNTAVFINASRGGTVNESALIEALQTKQILSAGLDVYEKEPIGRDHPLTTMSNVITLPHMGTATLEAKDAMNRLAVENLIKGLNGEYPPNLINKVLWDEKTLHR
jgi:gluconate 2-dehydrogenase